MKRYFLHRVRPYVGGGLAWIYGRQDRLRYVSQQVRATVSHRETTFGVYLSWCPRAALGAR